MPLPLQSVGIDVGKHNLVACILDGPTVSTQSFGNHKQGITELGQWLEKQSVLPTTPVVLESTGDYHLLPALSLQQQGYATKEINPIITKRYLCSSIRKSKTDKGDAYLLARIGTLEHHLPPLQRSLATIILKKKITLLSSAANHVRALTVMMKRSEETRAQLGGDCSEAINRLARAVQDMKNRVHALEKEIEQEGKHLPGVSELTSIVGISTLTAIIFLVCTDGKTFTDPKQLIAYVGLDPVVRESGTWHGKRKLSKRGPPVLRHRLFQAGWGAKQHSPLFKQIYDHHRSLNKHYTTCILILSRKLLRIMFAITRDHTTFDPTKITFSLDSSL